MFSKILTPIVAPYYMYRLWKTATPEQKAELLSQTTTEERKDEIAAQIVKTAYPHLA
jgi:hypothetical protein